KCRNLANENIHLWRECVLKTLIVYLREDPDDLIKEYLDSRAGLAEKELEQLTMAGFVILKEGEGLQEPPDDIGIVIEALQKIIMQLEQHKMSPKVQNLYGKLQSSQ
ncbi:Hypothetical protein SMAX5B_003302, partial [Scophthalmus maximus]